MVCRHGCFCGVFGANSLWQYSYSISGGLLVVLDFKDFIVVLICTHAASLFLSGFQASESSVIHRCHGPLSGAQVACDYLCCPLLAC